MRIAVLIAAAALVAGCSVAPETSQGSAQLTPITPSRTATPGPSSTTSTSAGASPSAPQADSPIADAIGWVEAADPVDAAEFNVALRGGTSTALGEDVAFTTPAGTSCMTDTRRGSGDLACLVDLADPPPQPPDVYGVWKGGWVDFDDSGVRVGSAHGDPGRFTAGQGPPLPVDRSLAFGDFRCRTDRDTLVCVNYARRSAVRYADSGVDVWGCTSQAPPPPGVGIGFRC